jgi:signal recognition particle GTPase
VIFVSVQGAKAPNTVYVIVYTGGRLNTKSNLML